MAMNFCGAAEVGVLKPNFNLLQCEELDLQAIKEVGCKARKAAGAVYV